MKILYTTEAVVEGGRAGRGRTSDGRLVVELSVPKEFGGEGGPGTNPEQLFAVEYAACFHTGLLSVAQGRKLLSASTEHRWNYRILRRLRELDANRISLEPEHSIV